MVSIEDLATQILGEHANDVTVPEFATCLQYGNGLVRLGNTGRGLAVLRNINIVMDPSEPGYYPFVALVRTPPTPKRAAVVTTRWVGKHWRDIGEKAGLGNQRPQNPAYKLWAPGATRSLSRLVIGGPVGNVMAETPDKQDPDNMYLWYDLTPVPVGGTVIRIAKDGHIMLFQRVTPFMDDDLWVRVSGDGDSQYDYGNASQLVRQLGIVAVTPGHELQRPVAFSPEVVRQAAAPPPSPASMPGAQPGSTKKKHS